MLTSFKQKNNLSTQDLKIRWEISFFNYFFQYRQKRSQKKNRTVIKSGFFRFDFEPGKEPLAKNMNFHFHAFSGWGTFQGPN